MKRRGDRHISDNDWLKVKHNFMVSQSDPEFRYMSFVVTNHTAWQTMTHKN